MTTILSRVEIDLTHRQSEALKEIKDLVVYKKSLGDPKGGCIAQILFDEGEEGDLLIVVVVDPETFLKVGEVIQSGYVNKRHKEGLISRELLEKSKA